MSFPPGYQSRRREEDSAKTPYESDSDASIDFDETTGVATFPSGMKYSIGGLDPGTKEAVVKTLNTSSKLALRGCSPRGQGYVFLLSETIEYHVRAPYGSNPFSSPSCSCQQDERSVGLQHPCRHTLWLCDQILSQLVPLNPDPYTWRIDGYTTKHGNVCDFIADYHFDVLADSLGCDIMAGESVKPRPNRVQTAREVLATLSGNPVENYRPDLVGDTRGKSVLKEGDLEETIFRMLLENDSFFTYFLAAMRGHGPLNPRFLRFRDRANAALDAFDKYIKASGPERARLSKDPGWCYRTLKDISAQIKSIIRYSENELDDIDRRAAAQTLVYILDQVVSRNVNHYVERDTIETGRHGVGQSKDTRKINLCDELVLVSNDNFILDSLSELHPAFVDHLLPDLDRIEQAMADTNIPKSYLDKIRRIILFLRRPSANSESVHSESSRKRTTEDNDPPPKRVK
ncbi:hypothetical protein F4802DRAFT_593228 [Xylaria palmicola]|nr:hypothetical protein F4802DRAFT_593228 [Xylaria palmicola]